MAYKPSRDAEDFIESTWNRVGAANKAVLARSAICLALSECIPLDYKPNVANGKDISTDALYGEIESIIFAALNYKAGKKLTDAERQYEFRRHFEWGCARMKSIWEDSGRDQPKFIADLLDIHKRLILPGVDKKRQAGSAKPSNPRSVVDTEVKLQLLTDAAPWSMNGPGTNSGLLVVSGAPGSGKSQLVLDLLAQLSSQGVRFCFFDLKGELEDDPDNERQQKNRKQFLEQTGAQYVRLIQEALPINPLWRDPNEAVNNQSAYEIAALFGAFVPQLGAKQVGQLTDTYTSMSNPDFSGWLVELEAQDATGVHRETIKRICDVNLFASSIDAIPLEDWLSKSIVIDFKSFNNDDVTKSLAVSLILNVLMKRLNKQLASKNGIQPLKMVLFVDEAHLLLPKEGKIGILGSLARQGRSWGFPVWLASQDADAFVTRGDKSVDFAELAECGIHFSPNTLSAVEQRRITGQVISKPLNKGEAVIKIQNKSFTGTARQYWRDGISKQQNT